MRSFRSIPSMEGGCIRWLIQVVESGTCIRLPESATCISYLHQLPASTWLNQVAVSTASSVNGQAESIFVNCVNLSSSDMC